jgi:hypothetical protein
MLVPKSMFVARLHIVETPLFAKYRLVRACMTDWAEKFRHRKTPKPVRTRSMPKEISFTDQWQRLTGIVQSAVVKADGAADLHNSAAQQLDLAQYALSTMLDELSAVMKISGLGGPQALPALRHVLEPASADAAPDVIAA